MSPAVSSGTLSSCREPGAGQHNIIEGAKTSFLKGDKAAYLAGIIAVLLGAVLVFFKFPNGKKQKQLLALYQAEDLEDSERAPEVPAERGPRLANRPRRPARRRHEESSRRKGSTP